MNDPTPQAPPIVHVDGYVDFLTASGPQLGQQPRAYYGAERELGTEELSNAYENDAVAARIIDQVVDDATRAKWDLVGLDQAYDWQSIRSRMDDLRAVPKIAEAWRWARLQRGSILVLAVDDGKSFDKPLDLATVRELRGLTVVDATRVTAGTFDMGRGSDWRRDPEFYVIADPAKPDEAKVHRSRVIRFDGVVVPPDRMTYNGLWGPSVLSRCWRSLGQYSNTMKNAEAIMKRISVMVLKMNGWKQAMCGSEADKDKARAGLQALWWGIDNLNLLAIDKLDDFGEVKRSIEGVKSMMEAAVDDLVMTSGCSRQIITGTQTSTGLNSDTKGERTAWHNHAIVQRNHYVDPALSRILEIEFAARRNRGEQVPDEWTFTWEPLEQEADADLADRAVKWGGFVALMLDKNIIDTATARQLLIDQGIVDKTELGKLVPPAAVNGGGESVGSPLEILAKVAAGELPAASAIWLISKACVLSGATLSDAEQAAMHAAVYAAAEHAKSSGTQGLAAASPPANPDPVALDEVGEVEPVEPDPLDMLLAEIPGDLMSPGAIVEEIKARMGLEVSTRLVHNLAKKYGARRGKVGGDMGYSARDIKFALAKENGLELPAEDPQGADAGSAARKVVKKEMTA